MNLALFDFDGTITSRELYPEFLKYSSTRNRRLFGAVFLWPIVFGYKPRILSPTLTRHIVTYVAYRDRSQAEIQQSGLDFAQDVIPMYLRPEAMDRIRWHQQRGDRIIIVSGALDVYLQAWCMQHQLEFRCSVLEANDGKLTSFYLGQQCVNQEKALRIKNSCDLNIYKKIYAYGDTPEDMHLLELAHEKYFCWKKSD